LRQKYGWERGKERKNKHGSPVPYFSLTFKRSWATCTRWVEEKKGKGKRGERKRDRPRLSAVVKSSAGNGE